MVSYLEELGYYTMAFHPYDKTFWARDTGYENLGFQEFYYGTNFANKELCHGYISDMSLTNEIIERFEACKVNNPDQPIFSFAVSIQNHVADLYHYDGADRSIPNANISTRIVSSAQEVDEYTARDIEEYYNGMSKSMDALEKLLVYFENYEEDTMIVFFGDHSPGFTDDIFGQNNEVLMNKSYRTPYMIWTNYENDYESYGEFNLSYFSSVLIEYLGFPKTQQYYMNKYMLKYLPVNTLYEFVKTDGLNSDKILDMMNVITYFCLNSPKTENLLPNWEIVE